MKTDKTLKILPFNFFLSPKDQMHFSFSRNGGKVFFFFFFAILQTRCEIWKISFLKYVMRYANQDHFADISEGKKP